MSTTTCRSCGAPVSPWAVKYSFCGSYMRNASTTEFGATERERQLISLVPNGNRNEYFTVLNDTCDELAGYNAVHSTRFHPDEPAYRVLMEWEARVTGWVESLTDLNPKVKKRTASHSPYSPAENTRAICGMVPSGVG